MDSIISILPKGEGFSLSRFGAVALSVRDFTQHSRFGAQSTVIGSVPGPGFEGIRYVALPKVRWFENRTRGYARQCANVINSEHAALVEIHNRPSLLHFIAPKVRSKLALHFHNDPQQTDYARTPRERRTLLARADAIYCVSDYIRNRFLDGLDETAQAKVRVIYNGLEMPASLPPKENLILFTGRMTQDKGALPLAQALGLALPQLPGWKAVLIGSNRHAVSHTHTAYEKHVDDALVPIAGQVEQPGFLSHPQTLGFFARASIAVVPSLWQEPFGRTALEAMAYGCAVITSGRGGLSEVTGDAALTLKDVTPQTIAAAITALAQNAAERERLGSLARSRAARFSIAACTSALDDARAAILAGANAHAA